MNASIMAVAYLTLAVAGMIGAQLTDGNYDVQIWGCIVAMNIWVARK